MAQGDKDIDERLRTIRTKYRRDNNLDLLPAVVGDAAGNVIDPALPGNVYVREQTSNGLSDKRSVRAPVQLLGQLKPGVSVLLERDVQGRLQIAKINADMLLASGGNPIVYQAQAQSSGTPQAGFETLRLIPTSPASLVVALKSWYVMAGNSLFYFPGAPVDLTASVPSAGNMLYAVIGVKSDFITTEIAVSTARLLTDVPLSAADINEAVLLLSTGTTPTWAVKLVGGQTTITQTDIQNDAKDLRQLVNTGSTAPGGHVGSGITVTAASVTAGNYETILCDCTSNNITVNLPMAASKTWERYNIKKIDSSANTVTIDGAGAETIDGATTQMILSQWTCVTVQSNGTAWYIL